MSFSKKILPVGADGLVLNPLAKGVVRVPLNGGDINSALGYMFISAGSSDWTSVHIAPAKTAMDELYLWACRDPQYASADPVTLSLSGGFWALFNSAEVKVSLASGTGLQLVWPGLPMGGDYPQVSEIKAKATDWVKIYGFAVRRYVRDPNSNLHGYSGETE